MSKPLLSIGMIFTNEIRCMERCLKSLQPLRDSIPCELVMADTGSNDGSREVAARYADILFDFPWINDFSAARNAVMDRCSGVWYLNIDCDEWFDADVSELVKFIVDDQQFDYAALFIRNYASEELEQGGKYSDFMAIRLMRMSTGLRFEGAIHEKWPSPTKRVANLLKKTILHHDGYLHIDPEKKRQKKERNMVPLRRALETAPEDLIVLMQCVESAEDEERQKYARQAVECLRRKVERWEEIGPALLRDAIKVAHEDEFPEYLDWIQMSEELFPDSIFTKIDVAYYAYASSYQASKYEECVRYGERYLQALVDYRAGKYVLSESLYSTLMFCSEHWELKLLVFLAGAYLYTGHADQAWAILDSRIDGTQLSVDQAGDCARVYTHMMTRTDLDITKQAKRFWEQIATPEPTQKRADQRKKEVLSIFSNTLEPEYQMGEEKRSDFHRHAYTLLLTFADQFDLGRAAAVLEANAVAEVENILCTVEDWNQFPIHALLHTLERGASFPVVPMYVEELDSIAARLAKTNREFLAQLALTMELPETPDALNWTRAVILAALHTCKWDEDKNAMALLRRFAELERKLLPLCYTETVLCENGLRLLPPMHRFGWYLIQAFDALDTRDELGYIRLLREGLTACENMKDAVEFLTVDLQERQRKASIASASPELLALAEQVRSILAQYDPNDPAVAALKASPAYEKIAFLLEELEGRMPQ